MIALILLAVVGTAAGAPKIVSATDGRAIHGESRTSGDDPHPGVLFVGAPGEAAADWSDALDTLAKEGFTVWAIQPRALAKDDPLDAAKPDVDGALASFRTWKSVDPHRIFLGGAGDGAFLALKAADENKDVLGFVSVSARLSSGKFDDQSAMHALGDRPVFLAAARGDKNEGKSALVLSSYAKGASKIAESDAKVGGPHTVLEGDTLSALALWLKQLSGLAPIPTPGE